MSLYSEWPMWSLKRVRVGSGESNSKKKKKSHVNSFHSSPNLICCLALAHCFFPIFDEEKKNWLSVGFFQGIMGKLPPQPLQDLACAVLFYMFYWNGVKDPSISKVINSVPEIHCRSIVELFYPLSLACILDGISAGLCVSWTFPQLWVSHPILWLPAVEKRENKTICIPNSWYSLSFIFFIF